MTSGYLAGILALVFVLAGLFIQRTLRGSSRLQRRLFLLFLLLSFLPAAAVMVVNWRISERHLGVLASPGLHDALESSLELAQTTLERELAQTQQEAERLALGLAGGDQPLPEPAPGCSYRLERPGEEPLYQGAAGEELWDRIESPARTPVRREVGGESYLVAQGAREGVTVTLARRLPADLAARLETITQGSSRYRQLRLYYGDLLRGDLLLTLAALGLILLTVALLLSRQLARRIGGPLNELVRGTELVAAGDLNHQVKVQALDELGDLVAAFNQMTVDLRTSKDELVRAERIAAWQGVARRLAHEIKNPLTPIGLSMHRIRRKVDDPDLCECVDAVLEETENLRRLADEFSLYARLPAPEKRLVDLLELLHGVVDLYAPRTRVTVHWEGWPEKLPLRVDGGQMRQAFANLVKNAIEAMGGAGRLTLRLCDEGKHLALEIEDTGPGLPPTPEDLFEPYVTTKESGTGLGLAIAQKIVADHGGRLSAAPGREAGAVFRIELPRASDAGRETVAGEVRP